MINGVLNAPSSLLLVSSMDSIHGNVDYAYLTCHLLSSSPISTSMERSFLLCSSQNLPRSIVSLEVFSLMSHRIDVASD